MVGGLSMNLALGTLYGWSVFVAPLEAQFGWKRADTSMVFTIAVIVFALLYVATREVRWPGIVTTTFVAVSLGLGLLLATALFLPQGLRTRS